MKQKLIIFDCDGVLVDSEYIASRVFAEALSSYGYQISVEESIQKFTGVSDVEARQIVLKESTVVIPENYWALQESKLHQAYEIELTALMQPVLEILNLLNIPRCVASNSQKSHVLDCLKYTQQIDYFAEKSIFSAKQVNKPKPAPDLFLFAADQMGFSPEDCIVVEDSLVGTQAALSAGMEVLVFLGGRHAQFDWYKSKFENYDISTFLSCQELLEALHKKLQLQAESLINN